MASKTIKYYYEEIKFLAAKIGELGLVDEIIEAAKERNKKKLEEVFDKFKEDNPKVWDRLFKFYEEPDIPMIFAIDSDLEENEEIFIYDPAIINPLNLCVMLGLSDCYIDETDIFEDWRIFQRELCNIGQEELADYLSDNTISVLDDFIEAFQNVE